MTRLVNMQNKKSHTITKTKKTQVGGLLKPSNEAL